MTTGVRARPGKRDVAVNLAACILAIQRCVGKDLAGQRPRVGAIDEQARAAFRRKSAEWSKLVLPVIADALALRPAGTLPGENAKLAPWYAAELGDCLSRDAATALAAAMDVQLAKGAHPDVAWQRTVAGYGLSDAAMRGYITAASTVKEDGSTALLAASKPMAQRALLAQADRIGEREAAAWSTLPQTPVAKRFDPSQQRDSRGQWTAEPMAANMAAALNADSRTYVDDSITIWGADLEQLGARAQVRSAFEKEFGEVGNRLTAAVDDWAGHRGVSRARHVEHGTQDKGRLSQRALRRKAADHQLLIDTVRAAPPTEIPLYRGASYADTSLLRRGAVLALPLTSFSATTPGAERFAWKGWLQRNKTSVLFETAPGARALNLTPIITMGVSPNEWVTNGKFKVTSTRREQREIRLDPTDKKGKLHDVLVVKLRQQPDPVAKAYDPQELRDETGRWATKAGNRVRVADKKNSRDAVDDLLSGPVAEPDNAYINAGASPYVDANAYVNAGAYADMSAYADTGAYLAAGQYLDAAKHAAQKPRDTANLFIFMGAQLPSETPPDDDVIDADPSGLYIPMSKLDPYFNNNNIKPETIRGRTSGTPVDFTTIGEHLRDFHDDYEPIEAQSRASVWDMAGDNPDIDSDDWSDVVFKANKLWHDVQAEPVRAASLLKGDVATPAGWAGYPEDMGTSALMQEVRNAYEMREKGIRQETMEDGSVRYRDDGLLDAVADYVVWLNPESWGAEGRDLAGDLDYQLNGAMAFTEPTTVMSFGDELAPDEDAADMYGNYAVHRVYYHSALGELGGNAPVGQIGLREIKVKPDRV